MRKVNEEEGVSQNEVMPPPPSEEKPIQQITPARDPIKSYLGIFTIAKREFFANLKSVRMIVLMVLFILAVLGGSYGFAGISSSPQPLPDVEVLNWVILGDADDGILLNDLLILITDGEGNPRPDVRLEYLSRDGDIDDIYFSGFTDSNGVVIIHNVSLNVVETHFYRVTISNKVYERAPTSIGYDFSPLDAYVLGHTLDLDDDNIMDDALIMVLGNDGLPVTNVTVIISSSEYYNTLTTDSKGLVSVFNLRAGEGDAFSGFDPQVYDLEVTYMNTTSTGRVTIFQDDETVAGLFDLEGPNEIIYVIAAIFITMLGPIIAISLSFDSITKEKLQKSMDFLLSRPMGRRGIILGKFLGILSAIILPVTAINILAVLMISSVTGEGADGTLVAGFIIYTIIFIAIYILLQQIFSTLAKTTGTAILSGIAIWLVFNLFWGLISLAVGAAMGLQWGSDAWISMNNRMALVNPGGSYQLALGYILPASEGTDINVLGVESWMPALAMVIWLVLLFILATEIFVRKTDS
jgi:ABC-type transport system involved in multi-copper enzyme maturation permease subunit